MKLNNKVTNDRNISFYYKTPVKYKVGFHAKTWSSHEKITRYLHMWKDHRCYGYIINRAFRRKKMSNWNGFVFIGVSIINRTLHSRLEIQNFFPRVEDISLVRCAHFWNIFQHSKRNFVSPHGRVISSVCYIFCHKNLRDRNVPFHTLKVNYSKPFKLTSENPAQKGWSIPHTKTGTIELKHWHNICLHSN